MKARKTSNQLGKYIEDVKAKQKNLLWPSMLVNSRSVDRFLLKGSPNPTRVQRLGAWLFGLTYIGFGFCFVTLEKQDNENGWAFWIIAIAAYAVGALNCYNGSVKAPLSPKGEKSGSTHAGGELK